jgi:hypothetical protein
VVAAVGFHHPDVPIFGIHVHPNVGKLLAVGDHVGAW